MWKASFRKHILQFKFDAGTSRGVLKQKEAWYITLQDEQHPEMEGIGECGPLKGLSIDDLADFETQLSQICQQLTGPNSLPELKAFPSLQFGLETAIRDLQNGGGKKIFDNDFYSSQATIPINGLVWMGSKDFMTSQVKEKLQAGYRCLKLKVGALDFDTELEIIKWIRNEFPENEVQLRLDANGAFSPQEVHEKLGKLAQFKIHSIEQPIKAGQEEQMASLCINSPIPIALDEELIGIKSKKEKLALLKQIRPPYIILKPTLLGGFAETDEWIQLAEEQGIDWWITSALESNIGLNAICQYTFEKTKGREAKPQGLGTGSLYFNNIESPLKVKDGTIHYQKEKSWGNLP